MISGYRRAVSADRKEEIESRKRETQEKRNIKI
jgi:hypothetical protein